MKTQDLPADGRALPAAGGELSEAVRAAQERLLELRRAHGVEARGRTTSDVSGGLKPTAGTPSALKRTASEALPSSTGFSRVSCASRGFEPASSLTYDSRHTSQTLVAHLRAAGARRARQAAADDQQWLDELRITNYELRIKRGEDDRALSPLPPCSPAPLLPCSPPPLLPCPPAPLPAVRLYPDLAPAILRRTQAAAGRVWLLLRQADAAGRGRVAVAEALRLLCGDGSPLRICGRRQLTNLLAAGEGLFWQRDRGRDGTEWLRLHSAARLAAGLGVARLGGSPVAVPVGALTGTIGQARAHLYAAFHSGRTSHDLLSGERRARGPIARETLCKLSGASRNSQRNYERRAAVGRRSAIALGPRLTAVDEHEVAWQRGRALFHYRDTKGRYGRPGAVYLAWQLPNEYTGPHATLPRGGQKRLNRAISDLFHDGMTGNGDEDRPPTTDHRPPTTDHRPREEKREGAQVRKSAAPRLPFSPAPLLPSPPAPQRLFYNSAKAAFLARGEHERYWRQGGVWLWQRELRMTNDELRMKRAGSQAQAPASDSPPAT